ncbi:MAG: hypothetical protein DMF88_05500 [Acidobacteria bacterium]|nr:MAG: hypothetical protein DMF88_05500 [Acidobacteriota bacterium]
MRSLSYVALTIVVAGIGLAAQETAGPAGRLPPGIHSGRALQTVPDKWMWHMGMLRGLYEVDGVAALEIRKATGTVRVDGQACTLQNYRASINYWLPGMRAQYTCTTPDGRVRKAIEVVNGQFAWDEDIAGAELVAGKGTATAKPTALAERLIRIWSGPQGAAKAAAAGGANLKITMENGKTVAAYPIPGVAGAVARATLSNGSNDDIPCASYCAERVEVRQGNVVTEFLYSNYADLNEPLNKIDAWYPGHVVEKRDGVTILDLTIAETETGNPYVVMPVPPSVRKAR